MDCRPNGLRKNNLTTTFNFFREPSGLRKANQCITLVMNTIFKLIISSTLTIIPTISATAQTPSKSQQIVEAVEKVYNEELQEDSRNYNVYFRRAHLYYSQNQYLRALSDVDNAIRYTPATDRDMLSQEYALRGNIYMMTDRLPEALDDITKALKYEPSSYALLYQKANIEYELGKYQEAKEDYQRLSRLNNRSLESLIGLARVAIKENNLGVANEYADEAVAMYPSESEAYLRRASVRQMMGNNTGAVDDMILAVAVDRNSSKAIQEIVNMANTDYNAVISGLSNAINQAPNVGIYYYIRAMIAQAHYHYISAIDDYNTIINNNLYNYHGIHAKLAECYYALCDYTNALNQINIAIGQAHDHDAYYVTSSKIYLALGNKDMAKMYADRALEKSPESAPAITQSALCSIAFGDYDAASAQFGELIINNPNTPVNYIIRGWIIGDLLNSKSDAIGFLTRCSTLDFQADDYRSYLGFAENMMGQNEQAQQWIDSILAAQPNDVDGHIHYIAAALYSHLGDTDKAFNCMEQALAKGYANLYDWRVYDVANLSVAPLRNNPPFDTLLSSYSYLFKK